MESQLDARDSLVFERLVDLYIETGRPVGSRVLSNKSDLGLSAATLRNVMSDLEVRHLIESKHVSGGRQPTAQGLNMFIDQFVQTSAADVDQAVVDNLGQKFQERADINHLVSKANEVIGDMTKGIAIVAVPEKALPIEQIHFIRAGADAIVAVIVMQGKHVENRLIPSAGVDQTMPLDKLSNYMTDMLRGYTIAQAQDKLRMHLSDLETQLSVIEAQLAAKGLEGVSHKQSGQFFYKVSSILENEDVADAMESLKRVYNALEQGEAMRSMLDVTQKAPGMQVFIGAEHKLFAYEGLSTVLSPIKGEGDEILGAFAYIMPQRAHYRRIIPAVNYTSRMIARLIKS